MTPTPSRSGELSGGIMVPSDMSGEQGKGRLQIQILKTSLIYEAGRPFVHASMANWLMNYIVPCGACYGDRTSCHFFGKFVVLQVWSLTLSSRYAMAELPLVGNGGDV